MRSALFAVAVAAAVFSGCMSTVAGPEQDGSFLSNAVGTVERMGGSETYLIRVERPRETFVQPSAALPRAFQRDGLRVEFSGELLPIPPNVRLAGLPIELSRIARAD